MKVSFKALLILILCLALCHPAGAAAPGSNSEISIGSVSFVNSPDASTQHELPVLTYSASGKTASADAQVFHDTMSAFLKDLRLQMTERKTNIVIGYKTNEQLADNFYDELIDRLFDHTGNPKEGDYIAYTISRYSITSSGKIRNNSYFYTFTFDVSYYTNAEQEAQVDKAVEKLTEQWLSDYDSDYDIVKAVYDYICSSVSYDNANLENPEHKLKYSAYAALINNTAICQGYANLFYRLALECGIDCRIIAGYSGGESHAWNIVKLDGYYYNLDSTWDSTISQAGGGYEYFLKCDRNFNSHMSAEEFLTEEFSMSYPKANVDYDANNPAHRHEYSDWSIDIYATTGCVGEKSRYCACGTRTDITAIPYVDASTVFKNYTVNGWSKDGIDFVYSNGLMGDTGSGDFEQTGTMTRSMFVTVLWRMAGSPSISGESIFSDLDESQTWYHSAVIWAYENSIVKGTGADTFSPNGEVTREQIATFLYRYVTNYLKDDVSDKIADISHFPDESSVGSYAVTAVSWAYGAEIIKGQSSYADVSVLAPKSNATREEVAVMIERFLRT